MCKRQWLQWRIDNEVWVIVSRIPQIPVSITAMIGDREVAYSAEQCVKHKRETHAGQID